MKQALICGTSDHDRAYLPQFLLEKNYDIHGTLKDTRNRFYDSQVATRIVGIPSYTEVSG